MDVHERPILLVCVLFCCCSATIADTEYGPVLSWDVCSPSRIVVTLTGGAEGGIIYIRGYGSACKQDTTSAETVHEFEFEACGIGIAETYFTIIVQRNPLYQNGDDLQESLLCIYDLRDISVNNGVNVGDKADDNGINKTVKPTVFMSLYKNGIDVAGSDVKLTDLVTMTIQLDEEFIDDFDIKARTCTANYLEITNDHCAVDTELFPEFTHVTQGVVTSAFGAFRTTDLSGGYVEMVFTCTLTVCRGLCSETTCGSGESGWERRKRADEDIAFEDLNVGTSMSVGTDIDINPTDVPGNNDFCMNQTAFFIIIVTVTVALVVSIVCTTLSNRKLAKKSEKLRKLTDEAEMRPNVSSMRQRMEQRPSVSVLSTNTLTPFAIKPEETKQTINATNVSIATLEPKNSGDNKASQRQVSVSSMYAKSLDKHSNMADKNSSNTMTSQSRGHESTNHGKLENISEENLEQLKDLFESIKLERKALRK